jgi:hypothetical protein
MARTRSINPGFFDDEDVARLTKPARLLFVGLLTQADREGRLEDRPARLKARLFPYDDIDVEPLLAELHGGRFVVRYQGDGLRLIQVRQFGKHQNPHMKEAPSALPAPPAEVLNPANPGPAPDRPGASPVQAPVEHQSSRAGTLVPGTGSSGTGGAGGSKARPRGAFRSPEQAARFARWYLAYPRKENRGRAERAFRRIDPDDATVDAWLKALQRQRDAGKFADVTFTPHPASWLNDRRWEDGPGPSSVNGVAAPSAVDRVRAEGAAALAHVRAVKEGRA